MDGIECCFLWSEGENISSLQLVQVEADFKRELLAKVMEKSIR